MDIPYYLDPAAKSDATFGVFDIFGDVPVPEKTPATIWDDLGSGVSTAGDYVWDSVNGVWVSAKTSFAELGESLKETVKENFSFIGEGVDWLFSRLGLVLIGVIALIWVMGRSGAFNAIAAFFGAKAM